MHDYKNKNPYEILGVSETDSSPVIERAYRNKIYLYCAMNNEATDIYGNILKDIFTTALNILLNPETRKQLDQELAFKRLIESSNPDDKSEEITHIDNWVGIYNENGFKFIKIEQIENTEDIIMCAINLVPSSSIDEQGNIKLNKLMLIQSLIDRYIKENLEFKEQLTTNRGLTYIKKEM